MIATATQAAGLEHCEAYRRVFAAFAEKRAKSLAELQTAWDAVPDDWRIMLISPEEAVTGVNGGCGLMAGVRTPEMVINEPCEV